MYDFMEIDLFIIWTGGIYDLLFVLHTASTAFARTNQNNLNLFQFVGCPFYKLALLVFVKSAKYLFQPITADTFFSRVILIFGFQ